MSRVKQGDLTVAMRSMYYLLKEKSPFVKYKSLMEFLSDLSVTLPASSLPGNANLRSDRMIMEIIDALGKSDYCV